MRPVSAKSSTSASSAITMSVWKSKEVLQITNQNCARSFCQNQWRNLGQITAR